MDHHGRLPQEDSNKPSDASIKVERRIIERNRRNNMKDLYSKLNSLRPNYNPREVLPLPDQVDEAINYIKSLERNVKMANKKKQGLLLRKRSRGCTSSSSANNLETKGEIKSPKIQIHEVGSSLEVILTCGIDNQFIFSEIIRILHEENIEVISANSSLAGDSMINVVHAQIPLGSYQFVATKISDRLKWFEKGSVTVSDAEIDLLDFEIDNEIMMWEQLPDIFQH